jgi:hypothetical protein
MGNTYADHLVPAAVHIYPTSSNWTPEFDEGLKHADLANGTPVDPNKPIYITEMAMCASWPNGTTRCGPDYAWLATGAYSRAAARSNVVAVIYHRLVLTGDPFDVQGHTYFIDAGGNETSLTTLMDLVR